VGDLRQLGQQRYDDGLTDGNEDATEGERGQNQAWLSGRTDGQSGFLTGVNMCLLRDQRKRAFTPPEGAREIVHQLDQRRRQRAACRDPLRIVAGASDVIRRRLVPLLVAQGHEVTALTRRDRPVAEGGFRWVNPPSRRLTHQMDGGRGPDDVARGGHDVVP